MLSVGPNLMDVHYPLHPPGSDACTVHCRFLFVIDLPAADAMCVVRTTRRSVKKRETLV